LIGLPFTEVSLTGTTPAGYKGSNLGDELCRHRSELHRDSDKSVIFIDELDKSTKKYAWSGDSDSGTPRQNELIAWIEGATIHRHDRSTNSLDTGQIMFMFAGAFVGLEEIVAKRLGTSTFEVKSDELMAQATFDDLLIYGIHPELIGRITTITCVRQLTVEDMVEILKADEISPVAQQVRLLQKGYGLEVKLTPQTYRVIAEASAGNGAGARDLKKTARELFEGVKFNPQEYSENGTIKINTAIARRILTRRLQAKEGNGRGQPNIRVEKGGAAARLKA